MSLLIAFVHLIKLGRLFLVCLFYGIRSMLVYSDFIWAVDVFGALVYYCLLVCLACCCRLKCVCSPNIVLCNWLGLKYQLTSKNILSTQWAQRQKLKRFSRTSKWREIIALVRQGMHNGFPVSSIVNTQSRWLAWKNRTFTSLLTMRVDPIIFIRVRL